MEKKSDKKQELAAYLNSGRSYKENCQFQLAIENLQEAFKLANELKDEKKLNEANLELGDAYGFNSQIEPAIEYFEKALQNAKEREDKQQETDALLGLGYAKYSMNDQIDTAIGHFQKALKIAREQLEDKQRETRAHIGLGDTYRLNNQIQTAIQHYQKALKIAKEREDKLLARKAIEELSRITDTHHDNSKDLQTSNTSDGAQMHDTQHETADNAEQIEIESESISKETRFSAEQQLILGRSYQRDGKTEKAIICYEEAFKIADETYRNDIKAKAYQHLGNLFTETSEYKKAIEYYQKAREIFPDLVGDELEVDAYQWLGDNHLQTDLYKESIKYYKEAVKLASQLGHKNRKINAYLGLEKAHIKLGHVSYENGEFDAAVTSYLKAQEIAADLGERKEEASACFMLGDTFKKMNQEEKAIEFFQRALEISKELEDKETQVIAEEEFGILCLKLASVCSKDCDYEGAVKWFEKMLSIFGTESNNQFLRKKALTGLGVAWFNLGYTEKAIESIQGAQKFAKKETNTDDQDVKSPQKLKISMKHEASSSPISANWLKSFEETCNPTSTEWLPNEDLATLEKHIEEFSASNVYTLPASSKEPLTEKVRKSMTANVKSSACKTLLSRNRDKFGESDGKFVDDDQQIFDFARDDLSKNAATKIPARLLGPLSSYMKSVGQISCGKIRGTCFLVTDILVITNYHVFSMINAERIEVGNSSLPITVSFDYINARQREHAVTVEVDEERDPKCENRYLDYKFLRLKENEGLRDRVPLGGMVRCRPLQDGLVIILGHPEGSEMHEETCVVVTSHSWREKLQQRHERLQPSQRDDGVSVSLHMTNDDLLRKYRRCLPYDTSLFSGASGSPVFDLNGNIVAMHTQGYTLDVEGGKCSLMEFGVQFSAICEDLKQHKDFELFFPNYMLGIDEERMDED